MSILSGLSDFLKVGAYNYCQLETIEDEHTFVTKDGGFVTIFEVLGTSMITSHKALADKHETYVDRLQGNLATPGFRIQFVFSRNPEGSLREIQEMNKPVRNTMRALGLDFGAMLDEREKVLGSKTASERCYMVISTSISVMPKQIVSKANKDRTERAAGVGIKPGRYGQSPFIKFPELYQTHIGFTENIYNVFSQGQLMMNKLTGHEALKAIRMEIAPDMTSENWRPYLPGDRMPKRMVKEDSGYDMSHIMYPNIGYQLFPQAPEFPMYEGSIDKTMVKIGEMYNAPLLVDLGPQDTKPFSDLFYTINKDIPWRFSISIETGSEKIKSKLNSRKSFATFLKITNSNNNLIMDACQELIEWADNGTVLVNVNMSFCTWGKTAHKARQNKAMLAQSIQSWGYVEVIEERGDAIEAWLNTVPAISDKYISNILPMSLSDAIYMVPFSRPASPWKKGSMLFRTIDDKLFPYLPGSSLQTTWVDLVFAPPGFGKSFFLAASNMALILAPGNKLLPRISIIDIGFSSAAFVQLIKNALPPNKRHLAESFKIEMDPNQFMINPFDTPLGCNHPLAIDKEWLNNFLTILLTPANEKNGIPRLGDVIGMLVEAMYEYYDVDSNPKYYEKGIDEQVDKAIHEFDIVTPEGVTWYAIRDELFKKGKTHDAGLAQRHGVPNLNDATEVLNNRQDIRHSFAKALYGMESLLAYLESMLVSSIRSYPILSGPSIFDTGTARIISMDLASVAKSGSIEADKKTGVMYMLARQIMCKEFYRNESTLVEIPRMYKKHHAKVFEEESMVPKKICMDEFHRTQKVEKVREQVITDIREGRKFDVQVALLSQSIDDFDPGMVEFATNIYILSKGITEDTIDKIVSRFQPSEDAIRALRTHVNGPVPGEGSTMLYLASIKGQQTPKVEHPIRLTLGPVEMWAYSTTHEDVILRRKLTEKVGLSNALSILSEEYPNGAKEYIETKKLEDSGNEYLSTDEESDNVYDIIIGELMVKYRKKLKR